MEPSAESEGLVCYEVSLDSERQHHLTLIHYKNEQDILSYSGSHYYRSIINSFSEGYSREFVVKDIDFYIKTNALFEAEVIGNEVRFGLYEYCYSDLKIINSKGLEINGIDTKYYPSLFEANMSGVICFIKWLLGMVLLALFDYNWICEILHHSRISEAYTNLLSPIHMYLTIPVITITILVFCIMDLGAYYKMRMEMKKTTLS